MTAYLHERLEQAGPEEVRLAHAEHRVTTLRRRIATIVRAQQ